MSHISENDSLTKKYYFFSYYLLVTHSDLKGFKKNKITSYIKHPDFSDNPCHALSCFAIFDHIHHHNKS